MRLPLRSTSRSRAVVARRAHNPKVGSSNLPFATSLADGGVSFFISRKGAKERKDGAMAALYFIFAALREN